MLQMQLPRNWSFHLENFRQGEDKKRSAAWDEAGRKPGSFFPTWNSIVLHLNFCKTDIFVVFKRVLSDKSPAPPGPPPATAQSCQPPPSQLEPLWYSGQSWDHPWSYIYAVICTFWSSAHGYTSHLDGYMHIYSFVNYCSQPIPADKPSHKTYPVW